MKFWILFFFVSDVIIRVGLGIFGPDYWASTPWANFLTKFLVETTVGYEIFESLISHLVFVVWKLWQKIDNCLINLLILGF